MAIAAVSDEEGQNVVQRARREDGDALLVEVTVDIRGRLGDSDAVFDLLLFGGGLVENSKQALAIAVLGALLLLDPLADAKREVGVVHHEQVAVVHVAIEARPAAGVLATGEEELQAISPREKPDGRLFKKVMQSVLCGGERLGRLTCVVVGVCRLCCEWVAPGEIVSHCRLRLRHLLSAELESGSRASQEGGRQGERLELHDDGWGREMV